MKYLRLLGLCLLGWWPMMAVHELGHVLGCLVSGTQIEKIILWPWTLSQTVRTHSNAPLLDTWAGPVFGAMAPAILYYALRRKRFPGRAFLGFFAGFCLLANGLYIGAGWLDLAGDAGDLIRLGAPRPVLILFGIVGLMWGLLIWGAEVFPPACPAHPAHSRKPRADDDG